MKESVNIKDIHERFEKSKEEERERKRKEEEALKKLEKETEERDEELSLQINLTEVDRVVKTAEMYLKRGESKFSMSVAVRTEGIGLDSKKKQLRTFLEVLDKMGIKTEISSHAIKQDHATLQEIVIMTIKITIENEQHDT